jgi:hypothetical protein
MTQMIESNADHRWYLDNNPQALRRAEVNGLGGAQFEVAITVTRYDGERIDLVLDVELAHRLGVALAQEAYLSMTESDSEYIRTLRQSYERIAG